MKIQVICLLAFLCSFSIGAYPQEPTQTNSKIKFDAFLAGVKYACLLFDDKAQKNIDQDSYVDYANRLKKYLYDLGFEYVAMKSSEIKYLNINVKSVCETCYIELGFKSIGNEITDIYISFYGCDGSGYKFISKKTISDNNEEYFDVLNDLYHTKKKSYSEKNRLLLDGEYTSWSEIKLKEYLNYSNDELEGIYERMKVNKDDNDAKYKIGIVKNDKDGYDVIYIDGALNYKDWREGEKKATIKTTSKENFYTVDWLMQNKDILNDAYAYIDKNELLNIVMPTREEKNQNNLYLKLYPANTSKNNHKISMDEIKSSGSGIIITQNGYFVTCNHVIDKGRVFIAEIEINGRVESYSADLITKDENNDLAILKINDAKFNPYLAIPYSINSNSINVGSEVFALGFPLIQTMGNELKVTNGIISSKTGFQSNANQYTVSIPVQSGNSGGPLFDYKGNLVGIINAKHLDAENVTYAIKSNSVSNIIDLVNDNLSVPNANTIKENELSKMVEILRNYVVLIKVK